MMTGNKVRGVSINIFRNIRRQFTGGNFIPQAQVEEDTTQKKYIHIAPCGDWWLGAEIFAAKHNPEGYVCSIYLPPDVDVDIFSTLQSSDFYDMYDAKVLHETVTSTTSTTSSTSTSSRTTSTTRSRSISLPIKSNSVSTNHPT
jgi:hypothetical protein